MRVARCAEPTEIRFETDDAGEPHVLVNGNDATRRAAHRDRRRRGLGHRRASRRCGLPCWTCSSGFRQAPGWWPTAATWARSSSRTPPYKVFLTASADERARRRYKQLKDKGVSVNLDSLLREIAARDERDAGRAVAPLKPADDAVIIDTTGMPIAEVIERVLAVLPDSLPQPR